MSLKGIYRFNRYLVDARLLGSLTNLYPQAYVNGNRLFTEFKNALVENYIAQCLQMHQQTNLFYCTSSCSAEVGFLIQHKIWWDGFWKIFDLQNIIVILTL